jgi:hypothetical protein
MGSTFFSFLTLCSTFAGSLLDSLLLVYLLSFCAFAISAYFQFLILRYLSRDCLLSVGFPLDRESFLKECYEGFTLIFCCCLLVKESSFPKSDDLICELFFKAGD